MNKKEDFQWEKSPVSEKEKIIPIPLKSNRWTEEKPNMDDADIVVDEFKEKLPALYLIREQKNNIQIPEAKQQYKNQNKGYPVVFFHF